MSDGYDARVRIGDAERESAVAALGEHYASGRLTKDEFDERSAQAYEARTSADLWPLFGDLPHPSRVAASFPRPTPGPPRPHQSRSAGRNTWWAGAKVMPVLLVLVALVAFTSMPWFVPVIVAGILFMKFSRCR